MINFSNYLMSRIQSSFFPFVHVGIDVIVDYFSECLLETFLFFIVKRFRLNAQTS